MRVQGILRTYMLPTVVAALGSGVVGGLLSLLVIPREYTASALLLFPMRTRRLPGGITLPQMETLPVPSPYQVPVPVDVAKKVLESRQVGEKVVERLGLKQFFKAQTKEDAVRALKGATDIKVTKEGMLEIKVTLSGTPQGLKWSRPGEGNPDDYEVRKMAARIVNEYVKVLREFTVDLMRSISTTETLFLAQRLRKAEKELRRIEAELARFRKKAGILSAEQAGSTYHDLLKSLEREKEQTRIELVLTERSLKTAKERLRKLPRTSEQSETESLDPGISALMSDLARAEVDLEIALQKYGPKHPKVKELEARVEELKKRIEEGKRYILTQRSQGADPFYQQVYSELLNLELKRAGLKGKLAAIEEMERDLRRKGRLLPSLSVEEGRLKRRLEIAETVYRSLRSAYESARTQVERPVIVFHVVDWAKPPEKKSGPKVRQNALVALLLGGALCVFILLARRGLLWEQEE